MIKKNWIIENNETTKIKQINETDLGMVIFSFIRLEGLCIERNLGREALTEYSEV
jgi:hypothetical protein